MENLLKQIVNKTEPNRSYSIVLSDNKTTFKTWFKPPIQLDKKKIYEKALINLETYYSLPNIDRSNKCFSYSSDANAQWLKVVKYINEFIQREMRKNSHYNKANDKCSIEISANTNT